MRKLLLMFGLLLFLPVAAMAQDTPRAQVFGGYSYFRADGQGGPGENMNGWNGQVTGNLNKWLGLTSDFSGLYGHQTVLGIKSNDAIYTYGFGPTVSYRKNARI